MFQKVRQMCDNRWPSGMFDVDDYIRHLDARLEEFSHIQADLAFQGRPHSPLNSAEQDELDILRMDGESLYTGG
jgi:hypothetical protein